MKVVRINKASDKNDAFKMVTDSCYFVKAPKNIIN
ncbi:Uncharacterised protein [Providencia heimbachae]|nr:Uncharacterised protein [Providencia heimbachae]